VSLDTYTGLKAAISSWLNREDLTAQIPDFITMAEARFNRELRVNDMKKRSTTTITSGYVDLPADWLQSIAIRELSTLDTDALEYVAMEEYYDLQDNALTGTPRYYTIISNRIHLLPAPTASTDLELVYYAKIAALSGTNASNWLLAKSPDLYLHASLIQAEAYLVNDERVPMWKASVDEIIDNMKLEGERASRPSGALRARKRSFG